MEVGTNQQIIGENIGVFINTRTNEEPDIFIPRMDKGFRLLRNLSNRLKEIRVSVYKIGHETTFRSTKTCLS